MKKIFAILLAAATLASLAVPAWADDETTAAPSTVATTTGATSATGDAVGNIEANGKFEAAMGGVDKISVVVSWADMTFTYNGGDRGEWLPGSHDYENKVNPYWEEKTATITVTNHSSVAVSAGFAFASATGSEIEKTITADFSNDSVIIESANSKKYQTATDGKYSAPAASTDFTVTGGAIAAKTATIGTITVTIGQFGEYVYDASTETNLSLVQAHIQQAAAQGKKDFVITCSAEPNNNFFEILATAFVNAKATDINLMLCGVTKIPQEAFDSDYLILGTYLKTIYLPDVTEIGAFAFRKCTALTSVWAPQATKVGGCVFKGCTKLESVFLPEVQQVDDYTFEGCSALTTISLPKCTEIEEYAFKDCTGLNNVDIPLVNTIKRGMFSGCTALESIELPSVTSVYSESFSGCTSLKSVIFKKPVIDWGNDVFENVTTQNITLTFANGQKQFNEEHGYWTESNRLQYSVVQNAIFCGYTFKQIIVPTTT